GARSSGGPVPPWLLAQVRARSPRGAEYCILLGVSRGGVFMAHPDVLIVDDDEATRQGLRVLLTNVSFSVDTAADGAQALEKIKRHDFGGVRGDVSLPGIGGLDLLARCIAKRPPPKVIVMTGMDTTET